MKRALVFVALAACGGKSAAPPSNAKVASESITLAYAAPQVGATWTEEKTMEMHIVINASGQQMPMDVSGHTVRALNVLAVDAGAVTKAEIRYDANDRSQRWMGQEQAPPSELSGKTFTITAGSPPTVTRDGAAASEAETKQLLDDEDHFGEPERMSKILDGKTFVRDEPTDLPSDEIVDALGSKSRVSRLTMTYRGMDGDDAKFDMDMEASLETGGMMTITLHGEAVVDPKGIELHSLTLTGTVAMSGSMQGTGSISMTETRE